MKNYKNIITVLLIILFSVKLLAEGDQKNKTNKLNKTNGEPEYARFNINKISTWIKNDGESDNNRNGNSGFVYPKGSNKACFFQSGLVWGGKVNGQIRVGGSTYNSGLKPGKILANGEAENSELPHVRIYRVRRDYKSADLSMEAEDEGKSINDIFKQYEKDWNEWRAEDGAPFEDINNDGIYNPKIDIPGVIGADQTIWFVANDLDEEQVKSLYGSLPIGIELQATFWGYKIEGTPLNNIMFRKYVVINKSRNNIKDMYFSMWSDPDLGDATDDLVGCDTLKNMSFCYNGNSVDATYHSYIPACGFVLLQGPVVPGNPDDVAEQFGNKINGKKNLGMTSFHGMMKSAGFNNKIYGDPNLGDYNKGTLAWYNFFQGNWNDGTPFPIPDVLGGGSTKFPFSGDPLTGEGYVDGILFLPADRRMGLGTGPFTFAEGDSQEVIFAQIAAGGVPQIERLESIKILKQYADFAIEFYKRDYFNFDKSSPSVNGIGFENSILLKWDVDKSYSSSNKFPVQGYNVYQLPELNSKINEYKRIKTFDIVDGIKNIIGFSKPFDGYSTEVKQFGTDNGIEKFIKIDKDYFDNSRLLS
ncbi:MAG: hypothetical protein F9K42_04665, partial [Ignavibacterium sp.]